LSVCRFVIEPHALLILACLGILGLPFPDALPEWDLST